MNKLKVLLLILIISIPSFISLLNSNFFPMHDDQHVARLFLLDQGIRQGSLFPRWVDTLGFNFGYPLFNFYPPLIYYVGEVFHLLGFSFIWSVKLTFITGFLVGALGMYLFAREILGKWPAIFSTTLYTYFSYHAVLIYVRGALAEFFAMAILPYVFLAIINLSKKLSVISSIFFGLSLAILILTHPLIAVPSIFFVGSFFVFYLALIKEKKQFISYSIWGGALGLLLSAFFWLPSLMERKFTLTDDILIRELASYKIHFVYLSQFLYSPWGYGGSLPGPVDGISFQLGRTYIALLILSIILGSYYLFKKKRNKETLHFIFIFALLIFSLFMATEYSSFIWSNIQYLWYIQFPWRFLTFAGIFISLTGGYCIYFLKESITKNKLLIIGVTLFLSIATIGIYQKYFQPSRYLTVTDTQLTSFDEIAWRVSRSSFEFIPKGVRTTKSDLNTTIPAINKANVTKSTYDITSGVAEVIQGENKFEEKNFTISAASPVKFRLNTYNFPGWKAYIDNQQTTINDIDDFKRIGIEVPAGNHILLFKFENTPVRTVGNVVSIITLFGVASFLVITSLKKSNSS